MSRSLFAILNRRFGPRDRGMSRRELLKSTLATGAAMLISNRVGFPQDAKPAASKPAGKRVVVVGAYDGAMAKIDAAEKSLKEDVSRLSALREKVAADLIGLKADRSNPEMEKLRRTEAEIAHYSKVLTSFADVNVQSLPKPKQSFSADLQSILK